MALKLVRSDRANAIGGFIPKWYGSYRDGGKVKTVALGVALRGRPPASGDLADAGDAKFELSRQKAQAKLDALMEKSKEKGDAVRETRHYIEAKIGQRFKDPALDRLAEIFLTGKKASPSHVAMIRSAFSKFCAFAAAPGEGLKSARTLITVTPELATAFFRRVGATYSFSTVKRWSNLLTGAFARFAPDGMKNPFKGARLTAVGRAATEMDENGEKVKVETVVHHKPLDRMQLRRLYAEAKSDPLLYNLAVTAASTGLRIGDACTLKWADVKLTEANPIVMVETTGKTGAKIAVPIFDYRKDSANYEVDLGEFRRILESALAEKTNGARFVFPEAARLYLQIERKTVKVGDREIERVYYPGREQIYSKGKVLFARALFADEGELVGEDESEVVKKTPAEVLSEIADSNWTEERKARVSLVYSHYSSGESYRSIAASTGLAKSTISTDLAAVESLSGITVKPKAAKKSSVREMLKQTQQSRNVGQRKASLYSWHSLRGSFVVLMLDNGVPLDMVRLLVGHTTTDMTLEYYNPTQRQAAESARRILTKRNDALTTLRAALSDLTVQQKRDLVTLLLQE